MTVPPLTLKRYPRVLMTIRHVPRELVHKIREDAYKYHVTFDALCVARLWGDGRMPAPISKPKKRGERGKDRMGLMVRMMQHICSCGERAIHNPLLEEWWCRKCQRKVE